MKTSFSYQFYSTTKSAWEAMATEMKQAQKSIYWEVFMLKDDKAGNEFIDILIDKAKQGLEIKIILDAMGSFSLSSLSEGRMKSVGIEILWFNRLRPTADFKDWFRRLWKRNHRKILIIDEKVGFIGGVNVNVESQGWDDLHLKLQGRVVRSLLYGFAKSYLKSGGNRRNMKHILHPKLTELDKTLDNIEFFSNSPHHNIKHSKLQNFYLQALDTAKESFTLLTPYYVPDKKFLQMIARANRKGVKVNIILPARTDHKIMNYIARTFFDLSTRAGANIFFLNKMNHGKAFSVDDKMGMVGSSNLNSRSLFIDEEAGVSFSENKMVEDLNNILHDWQGKACPLDLSKHKKKRSWGRRFNDWWLEKFKDYV